MVTIAPAARLAYVGLMVDGLRVLLVSGALVVAASAAAQDSTPQPRNAPPAAAARAAADAAVPVGRRDLDLTPPDIRRLLPESQWRSPLTLPEDEPEPEDTVQVRAVRRTPEIPGGIASVFWALAHPSEAWRILAPAQ